MTSLHNLPFELFTQIAADLDASTFLSLCLCCHALNSLSTPYVYDNVSLHTLRGLRQFTITVIQKPMLSLFVRRFELHQRHLPCDIDLRAMDGYEFIDQETLHPSLLHAMKSRGYSPWQIKKRVWYLTQRGSNSPLLELLLPALENLEHIDVLPDTTTPQPPLRWMGPKNPRMQLQGLFRNLRSIRGSAGLDPSKWYYEQLSFTLIEAEILLRLPTLRSFSASVRSSNKEDYWLDDSLNAHREWLCLVESSNVIHLELQGIDPRLEHVYRLVCSCEKLKTLVIEWWHVDYSSENCLAKSTMDCLDALPIMPCLENLSLESCVVDSYTPDSRIRRPVTFTSRPALDSLKHLRLDASYFLLYHPVHSWSDPDFPGHYPGDLIRYDGDTYTAHLHQILPPNIEKLSLGFDLGRYYLTPFLICLRKLLAVATERHPHLTKIILDLQRKGHGDALCERKHCPFHDLKQILAFKRVVEHAEQVGVKVLLKFLSPDVQYWGMDKKRRPESMHAVPGRKKCDYYEYVLDGKKTARQS